MTTQMATARSMQSCKRKACKAQAKKGRPTQEACSRSGAKIIKAHTSQIATLNTSTAERWHDRGGNTDFPEETFEGHNHGSSSCC